MKWIILVAIPILSFALATSASYDLERVLIELENKEKNIDAIQFEFKQEINFTQMNNTTTVAGEALFGKQGRLRITKDSPNKQVTISDGKKVWVFNPAAKQVWQGTSKKWLESSVLPKGVMPLSNYVADLRKNFDLHLVEKNEPSEFIRLIADPKNKNSGYRIEMTVSTTSWLPVKTVYHSDSADVVTHLTNHQVNPAISDAVFKFTAPKGTDVISLN